MKSNFLVAAVALCIAANAQAALLYRVTFDAATTGSFSSGTYALGGGEVAQHVTGSGSALGVIPFNGNGISPNFGATNNVTASNMSVQGGMCVKVDGGTSPSGVIVDFDPAFTPISSITIEAVFLASQLTGTPNTVDLSYVFSTEWPGGGTVQYNIRYLGGGTDRLQWICQANTGGERTVQSLAPLTTNRWYHVAGVMTYNAGTPSASTTQMYLDGVSQGANTIDLTGTNFTWLLGCSHTTLGNMIALGHNAGNFPFFTGDDRGLKGAIDAIAVSDTALAPGSFSLTAVSAVHDWEIFY